MKVVMMTQTDLQTHERTVELFVSPKRAWEELEELAQYIDGMIDGSLVDLINGESVSADNGEALLILEWKEVYE